MTHPIICSLVGQKSSGKDTVLSFIEDHLASKYHRNIYSVKIAGPLKQMLTGYYSACGLSAEDIEDRIEGKLKEQPDPYLAGKAPRYAMQVLGGEGFRDFIDSDLWKVAFQMSIFDIVNNDPHSIIIITDVRYPVDQMMFYDSVEQINALGVVVRLLRNSDIDDPHPSEKLIAQLHHDHVIDNRDISLDQLREKVEDMIDNQKIFGAL